ncbi:MAG: hypothetical protein KJI72_00715 [Patescibacteria group bacterium]|nr:hypothetical protein [Patescibacteria group bacterium]
MTNERAGKGGSQKEQFPKLGTIRQGIRDLGEVISALTPERVRQTARANGVDRLMCLQNGSFGSQFYDLISGIDPERLSTMTIISLSHLLVDKVLVPLGRLERQLGGDEVARQWSEEVAQLRLGDSHGDEKKRRAFVKSVAKRIEAENQVALTSG